MVNPAGTGGWQATARAIAPGLAAATAAVAVSLLLHSVLPMLPAMTIAVVLGIAAVNLPGTSRLCQGLGAPG